MPSIQWDMQKGTFDPVQNIISEDFFDGFHPKETVLSVRTEDKFKFTNRYIQDFLEIRKGSGATIKEITDATGFDRDTVSKHLMYLVSTRQTYKINEAAGVYHKNGRIVHYKNMNSAVLDKKLYRFFLLQGLDDRNYIYIQEKEIGKLKSVSVKGGIMIDKKDFKRFIKELNNFSKEIEAERK